MLLFILVGCPGDPSPTQEIDCDQVTVADATGGPDACDHAACQSCSDSCGSDCSVRESYPPQYACPASSWDVYDFCPGWLAPTTPFATDIVELGCGSTEGESLTATSTVPNRIDVVHSDFIGGCCPGAVRVDVAASGSTLTVDYALVNDLCECYCELDVSYSLVEVPSGNWTVVATPSGASATVTVP